MELESSSGKGIYTAKAIQLAKIAINIKISNGLEKRVKESDQVIGLYGYLPYRNHSHI